MSLTRVSPSQSSTRRSDLLQSITIRGRWLTEIRLQAGLTHFRNLKILILVTDLFFILFIFITDSSTSTSSASSQIDTNTYF